MLHERNIRGASSPFCGAAGQISYGYSLRSTALEDPDVKMHAEMLEHLGLSFDGMIPSFKCKTTF